MKKQDPFTTFLINKRTEEKLIPDELMEDLGDLSIRDVMATQNDLLTNQKGKLDDLQNQIAKATIQNTELKDSCGFYEKAIYIMLILMMATAAINH